MKIAVIIPAAGSGKRFEASQSQPLASLGGGKSKVELDLAGRPVLMRSVELFVGRPGVEQVILAVPPRRLSDFKFRWGDQLGFHGVKIVAGGEVDRWQTVSHALEAVDDGCTHVAVHDAARPLADDDLIRRVFEAAEQYPAVIPGVPINATLKKTAPVEADSGQQQDPLDAILGSAGKPTVAVSRVVAMIDRNGLVEAQTPQVFELGLFRRAYAQIPKGQIDPKQITDDAGLVESLGEAVYVVEGQSTNLKITRQDDLDLASVICVQRQSAKATSLGKKRLFGDEGD